MRLTRCLHLTACAAQFLLSVFFVFVGAMKTFAPLPMLRFHHAWVAGLPAAIARSVGVSEFVCAATMMLGLFMRPLAWWSGAAAFLLVANQGFAVTFHAVRGELPVSGVQNGVLILALLLIGARGCSAKKSDAAARQV